MTTGVAMAQVANAGLGSAEVPHQANTGCSDRVGTALVRVGHELMRWTSKAVLLERMCEIAAEALGAETSSVLLRDPKSRSYLPVARHGESRRFAYLADPAHPLAKSVLARLRHETVTEVSVPDEDDPSRWLCIALRRGAKVVGIVVVGRLSGVAGFSHEDHVIAEGFARLASISLENARLFGEIERANRIKSDFVATLSHELRTPLNIILGYLSLVLEGDFGEISAEQRDVLGNVDRQAHVLLEMVQDTLDLSRLEEAGVLIERKEISVSRLLAGVVGDAQRMPRAADVEVGCEVEDGLPGIATDASKLKVVLRSLVSNALKFTQHGSVTIGARRRAGGVELFVSDTGPGLPRGSLGRIFEPFTQLGEASTRTHGGLGMGLYVARRITDLLGGTIAVSSRVGVGSTFQVWLPAVGIAATEPQPAILDMRRPSPQEQLS